MASHQIRNCVSAGVESTTYTLPDNVVWLGQAKNYVDNIIGTKVGRMMARSTTPGVLNGYVTGATYLPAYFSVIYALDFGNGYLPSITDDNKWQAKLDWFTSQSSSHRTLGDDIVSTWYNRNVSSSISLEYVDGKQYQYEHIMTWDNNNWSQLSDPTWTNSLGDNPVWTKETTLASSGVSKSMTWVPNMSIFFSWFGWDPRISIVESSHPPSTVPGCSQGCDTLF